MPHQLSPTKNDVGVWSKRKRIEDEESSDDGLYQEDLMKEVLATLSRRTPPCTTLWYLNFLGRQGILAQIKAWANLTKFRKFSYLQFLSCCVSIALSVHCSKVMDLLLEFLNIALPLLMIIAFTVFMPPYLLKFISFLKRSIDCENVYGKVVLITGASSKIGEVCINSIASNFCFDF